MAKTCRHEVGEGRMDGRLLGATGEPRARVLEFVPRAGPYAR
jgi:hypothetical protein